MTTFDTRARSTARRLIERYGKSCTLQHLLPEAYNEDTGTVAVKTVGYPVKALFERPSKKELEAGQVVATDEVLVIPALGLNIEPTLNDRMTVDNRDRTIKMVNKVWSGEQVCMWRLGLAS